jgi:alkanesulfonate monooxygenase SsuD/methylene tetrahydromethanopterin reductase-like flavin-dependent oxidoreductase (luciferase family)
VRFVVRIHQGGWTYGQLQAVWQEADRLGYDGASLYDLIGAPGPECWTALTALTATTRSLTAVPLVLANPYRHPALLAKMAATLDDLSGGRLVLGLGAGGAPGDAAAFGLRWEATPKRVAAMEEAVQVMRLLWRGGGSFAGRFYQLDGASGHPRPAREGGPPILIGGHGERRVLRAVAEHADICNIGFDVSVDGWRRYRGLLDAYAQAAGRDPASLALSHNATVLVDRDDAGVERRLAAWAAARDMNVDAARERLSSALLGTPDAVIARLRTLEAAGVTWAFLLFQDLPEVAGLRLFAEAVLPVFR